jgi:4'-phosphopantetheinyl transferase
MEAGLTGKEPLKLRSGQVDIWLTSLSGVSSSDSSAYLKLLNESEQSRLQRFVAKDAQLQYLVARALVRTTLSRYARVPTDAWQFEANAYGRPYISQPQGSRNLRFNLSNTTGLVVCAISMDCEIGIDVESIARAFDADELAPSVFAPPELADFRASGSEERLNRFFSYWTLKESYIKARGMGLALPLDGFWFVLGGTNPILYVTDRCADIPERWRFYQYAPSSEHMMAVAVAAPQGVEPSIHLRWTTGTSMGAELA